MNTVLIFILAMVLKLGADHVKTCTTYYCELKGASLDFTISSKNDQVLEVIFLNSTLDTFPNQLIDVYPELRKCDISDSKVQHLDIKRATKLEWLDASRNQISELLSVTFKNIRGIVSLYLSRNTISNLTANIFADLPKLEVLDLSHNQISVLDENTFYNLKSLKFLYLNYNKIKEFKMNVSQAPNVIEIEGGHNLFNKYQVTLPNAYKGLFNLEYNYLFYYTSYPENGEIKLDRNRLDSLILKGKSPKVSANFNEIKSIEITSSSEVETLQIRNNLLTDIRNITEIVSIQVLDISSNPIESMEENEFNEMINLRHLSLRNTNLLIPKTFLPAQRKLISLDISENTIGSLDMRSLKHLINLQTLKIESCYLATIENYADQKEILPALKTISIDRNKLSCSFAVEFINLCWENEIQIMSDPLSIAVRSPNIMGINCIGIEKLDKKVQENYQWHGSYQPVTTPEIADELNTIKILCIMIFAGLIVVFVFILSIYSYRRTQRFKRSKKSKGFIRSKRHEEYETPKPVINDVDESNRCSYYM